MRFDFVFPISVKKPYHIIKPRCKNNRGDCKLDMFFICVSVCAILSHGVNWYNVTNQVSTFFFSLIPKFWYQMNGLDQQNNIHANQNVCLCVVGSIFLILIGIEISGIELYFVRIESLLQTSVVYSMLFLAFFSLINLIRYLLNTKIIKLIICVVSSS